MTSKERILDVLNGKIPDRVPISTYELSGYNSKSFENNESSYNDLMNYIRKNTDCINIWYPNSNCNFVESGTKLDVTTKNYDENEYHVAKTTVHLNNRDLTQVTKKCDNIMTVWNVEHLCKELEDVEDLLSLPFEPVKWDYSGYESAANEVSDHGIMFGQCGDPICTFMDLMEFGEGTVCALTEPQRFKECLDEIHKRQMINLENALKVQVMPLYRIYGPEYATPPYLKPEHFKDYVYPYLAKMTELFHRYGAKVRVHSHGKINTVLDMIIDAGVDAIDPCEAPPDGDITLDEVKRRSHNKITVFGNIQLKLLEHGTKEDVEKAVIACMNQCKEGSNFVIMPTASPINLPLSKVTEENYKVFIDSALKYGQY